MFRSNLAENSSAFSLHLDMGGLNDDRHKWAVILGRDAGVHGSECARGGGNGGV